MACDEGYAMPLATALRSLADSNGRNWPLTVYVLTDKFSENGKNEVARSLPAEAMQLNWVHVDLNQFNGLKTIGHISRMTFARLVLSDLLPASIRRVIYLDGDLLVLRELDALWHTDLGGACVGAVRDAWIDKVIQGCSMDAADASPDIPKVEKYFNAGVLLIDLDRWRAQGIGAKALQYLAEHPRTPYSDQDALNVALDGNWAAVSGDWNFQGHISTRISKLPQPPAIVHFITGAKPWMREHGTPNERLFDSYRRKTRFARGTAEYMSDLRKGHRVLRSRLSRKLGRLLAVVRGR